jgi:hypothetical protein
VSPTGQHLGGAVRQPTPGAGHRQLQRCLRVIGRRLVQGRELGGDADV